MDGIYYDRGIKMKNGCPECEKLAKDKLCPICELGMFQATAQAAISDYVDKVNEVLKEKQKCT